VLVDGNNNQWPCYNPQNSNQIVYQSDNGLTSETDPYSPDPPTGVFILDTSQPIVPGTNPHQIAAAAPYTDGGPSWSPDGTKIAFHSDRTGTFDIWIYVVATQTLTDLTPDPRSDGFPVWNSNSTQIAFTRDRELWTIKIDGTDAQQLTRRFQ
jgi:dipeptidyl aminopeptidase/acylaminoacyl peptidase